jgi:hypothetical protein
METRPDVRGIPLQILARSRARFTAFAITMFVSGIGVPIFTSWAWSRVGMVVGIVIMSAGIAVVVAVSMVGK